MSRMKYTSACVLAAVALLGSFAVHAESEAEYAVQPPAPEPAPARRPSGFAPSSVKTASRMPVQEREDRAFIRAAAASNRFEAEAARLALAKSTDPRVRALATDLIVQYNATSLELQQLLHVRDMALPMMENEHRRVLKRLARLAGRKLDREFLDQVGLKHQRHDLARYERVSARTADPSLKAWVDRQLPAMRDQVAAAERMAMQEGRLAKGRGASAAPAADPASPVMRASMPTQSMGAAPVRRGRGVSASGSP